MLFLFFISGPARNVPSISYEEIAKKLLNEKLLLTALELHAELCETDRELPILKDFFSNPNNFELQNIKPEIQTPMCKLVGYKNVITNLFLSIFFTSAKLISI